MRYKIPITPAFGSVMNATSEGTINDPTFEKQFTLKVYITTCYLLGGESGEEEVEIFTAEGCQFSSLSQCKEALKIMSKCKNTFYGLVKGGVYVYARAGTKE